MNGRSKEKRRRAYRQLSRKTCLDLSGQTPENSFRNERVVGTEFSGKEEWLVEKGKRETAMALEKVAVCQKKFPDQRWGKKENTY